MRNRWKKGLAKFSGKKSSAPGYVSLPGGQGKAAGRDSGVSFLHLSHRPGPVLPRAERPAPWPLLLRWECCPRSPSIIEAGPVRNQANQKSTWASPARSTLLGDQVGRDGREVLSLGRWGKTVLGARKVTATHSRSLLSSLMAPGRASSHSDL